MAKEERVILNEIGDMGGVCEPFDDPTCEDEEEEE